MILHLLRSSTREWWLANLAHYISVRSVAAAVFACVLSFLIGPAVIRLLRQWHIKEAVEKTDSDRLKELHQKKRGTPTMGGFIMLGAVLSAVFLFGNFANSYVLLAFCATAGFGLIGFIDDYIKLVYKDRKGLQAKSKMILQIGVALALGFALWRIVGALSGAESSELLTLRPPFLKSVSIPLTALGGIGYMLIAALIVVATSNGVNLTDGLDGLATGCVVLCAAALAVIAYLVGHADYARYLQLLHVKGCGELAVVASALAGSCLGFLWFNAHPAEIFMGDTGSLPLGGLLGYIAVVAKQELVLPILGGVFLMESLSVILQVGSFKLRGKRIFRCSPIHHHFQFGGMHEVKVTVRFWIVGVLCALLGLATLKVR
ncbi:MAG: phospho-N-acetylmuramoyl-pentapeptide-transferase [Planctomycetota bacterium]